MSEEKVKITFFFSQTQRTYYAEWLNTLFNTFNFFGTKIQLNIKI